MGGAFLEGTLPHPPGTRVSLELQLPGDTAALVVAGEVVEAPDEQLSAVSWRFWPLRTEGSVNPTLGVV